MRVFAGPNGSGKSTIFDQIEKNFDIDFYINPDLIERSLRDYGFLNLPDFGLSDLSPFEFNHFINNHSIINKAKKEGLNIRLEYDSKQNCILHLNTTPHSYEASLLADFLRVKYN